MRKLLSANFARLRKDKVFRVILIVVLLSSLVSIWNCDRSAELMARSGYVVTLDDYYFKQASVMGIFFVIFVSLFLGTEYSDGTMRNKLIIGHRRIHIYLANYIACLFACLIFLAVWLIGCAPGFFLIGPMKMGIAGFLTYVLVAICFTAAFAAMFTLIGTLSSNKAMTVIYTLLIWLVMLMLASGLYDRLCVQELTGPVIVNVDGELVMTEPVPNPLYLSGTIRVVVQCVMEFLPTGQAMLLADAAVEHPIRQIAFSLIFTGITIAVGYNAFRKKNIK